MSHPLVIAIWKMNIPSGGISGWIQNEMISKNDEVDFENKSSYSFNVIATDNGVGNLSAQKAVALNITLLYFPK